MRISQLFFRTLREMPADAEVISHQLMLRAGLVRQVAAGIFDYLPLGQRVKQKIETILREEMDRLGGQAVTLPVVQPAEIWQQTGRWTIIGDEMARLVDRGGRELCLGFTHEELMTDLVRQVVTSYRQLPFVLYQIQTKFRDEPRPRAGTIRMREFTMKDAYSFDRDEAGLDVIYPQIYQAYFTIFQRCGMDVIAVEGDNGVMGGTMSHEFMALTPIGEDTLLICDGCGYKANRQIATFQKTVADGGAPGQREAVHTPNVTTIAALVDFLQIPESATAKAIFLMATLTDPYGREYEQFVFGVVRGDMELNETKLTNAIKAHHLRPATVAEIRAIGAEPGYGSPIDIQRDQVLLVVDDLVAQSPNLVAGANRQDWHYRNVNYGRDYTAEIVADLVAAADGSLCANCGAALRSVRGVEVGNTFKLGTWYSEKLGATYSDAKGEEHPIVMGSYGIGVDRLIACIIEHHNDEFGIRWPISVAPYQVILISLATERTPDVTAAADQIYQQLRDAGIEVLYDDRDERAGVKFNDADLFGIPLRLTVGGKGLKNGIVERKVRRTGESGEIALDNLIGSVRMLIDAEYTALYSRLKEEIL